MTGRKIATKDCARRRDSERNRRKAAALSAEITQEGCLSFSINRFENFKSSKNASSLAKRLFRQADTGRAMLCRCFLVDQRIESARREG